MIGIKPMTTLNRTLSSQTDIYKYENVSDRHCSVWHNDRAKSLQMYRNVQRRLQVLFMACRWYTLLIPIINITPR